MSQNLIEIVEVVKATQRVDRDLFPENITFFSRADTWRYVAVLDDRTCEVCRRYEGHEEFTGAMLHSLFPFLEIVDVDLIMVHAHLNCRCYLERVIQA